MLSSKVIASRFKTNKQGLDCVNHEGGITQGLKYYLLRVSELGVVPDSEGKGRGAV
jgi:hypothetical protein